MAEFDFIQNFGMSHSNHFLFILNTVSQLNSNLKYLLNVTHFIEYLKIILIKISFIWFQRPKKADKIILLDFAMT